MLIDEIEKIIEPIIQDMGYIFWGGEYHSNGKYTLLRIYIDNTNGITVDDCALVSNQVSMALDVEDLIKNQYTMEVSSPGIPRPLLKLSQYNQFINHDVQLKLIQSLNGQKKWQGKIQSVQDGNIHILIGADTISIPFSMISKAFVSTE